MWPRQVAISGVWRRAGGHGTDLRQGVLDDLCELLRRGHARDHLWMGGWGSGCTWVAKVSDAGGDCGIWEPGGSPSAGRRSACS